MQKNHQSGQVALVVLLVLTISLTIGLSLIARSVNDLRITSNSEKSAQAYAAAEAGIEQAIKDSTINQGYQDTVQLDATKSASFNITSKTGQAWSSDPHIFPKPVSRDEAMQLWLFSYNDFINDSLTSASFIGSYLGKNLTVYWGTPSQQESDSALRPALEASLITAENSSGNLQNFKLFKYAYDPIASRANSNNFSSASGGGTISGKTYSYSASVPLPSVANPTDIPILLRLKLLYNTNKHEVVVSPGIGASAITLPPQGQIIDSEGTSGNVTRKIRVYQSHPYLPGIFDFALFNASNNALEK